MEETAEPQGGPNNPITLFLCGDVMLGRGIDQIRPRSVDPTLHERGIQDARRYVELAERENGPIPRDVDPGYVWGDALDILTQTSPDLRIINLETAVTTNSSPWPGKGVHYRMHPDNVACLTAADVDCCVLANNHVLDWGFDGLEETLQTLNRAGIETTGAGETLNAAQEPAVFDVPTTGRVLVFGVGSTSSGIPSQWAATESRPGIHLIDETTSDSASILKSIISKWAQPDDLVVVSVHWGPNWGYTVPKAQQEFAHALVDDGPVDLVHGHSSHHVKGIQIRAQRPILYGCGDFLSDYEGIGDREEFRSDLGLMYFAQMDAQTHRMVQMKMHPTHVRRFQITEPSDEDVRWLGSVLERESEALGTKIDTIDEDTFLARSP